MSDNDLNLDSKVNEFIKKVDESKQGKLDISADEDLSIAIMNLISIEEHFFFTAERTEDDGYLDLLNTAREMRKSLLKKMIKDYEGEVWCISKHLLAASMRLMEVGTKQLGSGKKEESKELFEKSFELYCLFFGLIKGVVPVKNIEMKDDDVEELKDKFVVKESLDESQESNGSGNAQEIQNTKQIKKSKKIKKKNNSGAVNDGSEKKGGFGQKLKDLVKKAVDCCIE